MSNPPYWPAIPASFVGQNVCMPAPYIEQLCLSFGVKPKEAPQVFVDPQILASRALGVFDPPNRIGFPTQTIYEIVAYHEFLHFLGQLRYGNALSIQREEHEVFQYQNNVEMVRWCLTCNRRRS